MLPCFRFPPLYQSRSSGAIAWMRLTHLTWGKKEHTAFSARSLSFSAAAAARRSIPVVLPQGRPTRTRTKVNIAPFLLHLSRDASGQRLPRSLVTSTQTAPTHGEPPPKGRRSTGFSPEPSSVAVRVVLLDDDGDVAGPDQAAAVQVCGRVGGVVPLNHIRDIT